MKPQIFIASLTPSAGKTTLSLGLLRLLQKRGFRVQPYKCGPDFIDSQYLSMSADKPTMNLDTWFSAPNHIRHVYNKYSENADISVIEGSAALFDGYECTLGSCSEIAETLNVPVILVVNARFAGYSIAAMIMGFKLFNPKLRIVGVVFNQITSVGQFKYLMQACLNTSTDCLGYIPYIPELKLPPKHSAITINIKRDVDKIIDNIMECVEQNIDINKILNVCNRIFPCQYMLPYSSDMDDDIKLARKKIRIAVARDVAFNYIYKENLEKLSQIGNIIFFSPLYSNELPSCDMLYIPNGVPELFARQLHRRKKMLDEIKRFCESGGKTLAEGNGISLLASTFTIREGGTAYDMAGVFPFHCDCSGLKLHNSYVNVVCGDTLIPGNEYHYCNVSGYSDGGSDIRMYNSKGLEISDNIFRYKNCIASMASLFWGENDIMILWR